MSQLLAAQGVGEGEREPGHASEGGGELLLRLRRCDVEHLEVAQALLATELLVGLVGVGLGLKLGLGLRG